MVKNLIVIALTTGLSIFISAPTLAQEQDGEQVPLDVVEQEISGTYYPGESGSTQLPTLVLGGAEGGIPDTLAQPVVAAGGPVLALAYFNASGVPAELENIPLEYIDNALAWLKMQHGGEGGYVRLVGWSKGAELALLTASRHPSVKHVVAIAPSAYVWAGILKDYTKVPGSSWTLNNKPLTHIPFRPSGKVKGLLDLYAQSLENRTDNGDADIPVTNIKAEVLLLTGSEDDIWPSPAMAETICHKMKSQQLPCEHINFDGRGHLLDKAFIAPEGELYQPFQRWLKGEVSR